MKPRLTIVIPTHNRPDMLPRALDAAIAQTIPVEIIVADDGDTEKTWGILQSKKYLRCGRPIHHLDTGAENAWDNWRAGMEAADTEYVAWLQDDDTISRHYAERILAGFDGARAKGADPHVWFGRATCSDASGRFGMWHLGNGPFVVMQDLHGDDAPTHFAEGACVAPSMYLTSWSLSPCLAYRNGPRLRAALAAMPPACDIFVERIIPAEMAAEGGFVVDPAILGHWVQHDDHLSHKQHADQPRQTRLLIAHLDGLLDRLPGWKEQFAAWCSITPSGHLVGWLSTLDQTEAEGGKSRHGDELRRLMVESLHGRVRLVPQRRRWRRALDSAIGWFKGRAAL